MLRPKPQCHSATAFVLLCALLPAAPAGAQSRGASQIARMIELETGRPAAIDPRLDVPACDEGLTLSPADRDSGARLVRCARPAWRLVVPDSPSPLDRSRAIRRGETVTVRRSGAGFEVRATLQAASSARPGEQILLQTGKGGRAVAGVVGEDGEVRAIDP